MDRAEVAHHTPGLIGLQPADEMPVEGRQIGQLGLLEHRLLQATFTKAALAGGHRFADPIRGLALAHRQQAAAWRQLGLEGGQSPGQGFR